MLSRRLIQRHRALARTALYLAPAALVLGGWMALRRIPTRLDVVGLREVEAALEREDVRLFRDYLQIDTGPDGDEVKGAEMLARALAAEGIPSELIRTGPRKANLWAVLEGEDPKALVLHNHIDVDPIRPEEEWTVEPFGAEVRNGWIHGRGAFDMKSVAIAQLVAFLELHRRGAPLRRSVVFLATGDEEQGSRLGTRFILRNRPDVVARLGAVLTEGGAVEALDNQTVKYWGTEVCQKSFVDVEVCDGRRERLEALRAGLLERPEPEALDLQPIRRYLAPEVASFLARYGATRDLALHRELLAEPASLLASERFFALPTYVKAMLRNELVAFPVVEDPGGGFSMLLILHVAPGATSDEAWSELLGQSLDTFARSVDAPPPAACAPLDDPIYVGLDRFMRSRFPHWSHGPLVVPWSATDARFFRAASIPAFGFSPFLILSTDTRRMSGANERISLPAFVDGVELYRALVEELASGSGSPSV